MTSRPTVRVTRPLTTTHAGFIARDLGTGKITFSASRAAGETVGTYDITPSADDAATGLLANYTFPTITVHSLSHLNRFPQSQSTVA